MRAIFLDSMQDAEHPGYHLDRELPNVDLEKFHGKQQAVLKAFTGLDLPAVAGLEMVAVFSVETIYKGDTWCYGGSMEYSFEVTPGMQVLSNNHMQIWLRDEEHRPVLRLASFFYKELEELLLRSGGWPPHVQEEVQRRIPANLKTMLVKKRAEIKSAMSVIEMLRNEEARLVDQYLCLS